jgi:hypothetical protein
VFRKTIGFGEDELSGQFKILIPINFLVYAGYLVLLGHLDLHVSVPGKYLGCKRENSYIILVGNIFWGTWPLEDLVKDKYLFL